MPDEKKQPSPEIQVQRGDSFVSLYSNNALVESTAWDVTLTFGQFDQATENPSNTLKASITIPFGVAKLSLYWLSAHVLAHEIETGHKIALRENVLPPPPTPPTDEQKKLPFALKYYEALKRLYDEFLASVR